MEKILITGGSGIIGTELSKLLKSNGYIVTHLSRSVKGTETYETFKWDIANSYIDPKALENVDHIIHLAGENVGGGRWNDTRKKRILSSRIDSLSLIKNNLAGHSLKSFISSSGISYYGTITTDEIFEETAPKGTDFLADVSVQWEKAAFQFEPLADRVVAIRTGVVLSPEGGALEKIKQPIKMGVGSALGSGKQYVPWLHLDDICGIYLKAVQDSSVKGIFNAVASEHCTNKGLVQAIAKVLNKKLWAPKVPAFMLKLIFGEMSVIVLEGSRISNKKIKAVGYTFKYDSLDTALKNLINQQT